MIKRTGKRFPISKVSNQVEKHRTNFLENYIAATFILFVFKYYMQQDTILKFTVVWKINKYKCSVFVRNGLETFSQKR